MQFTGTNLKPVEYGLQCALEETVNMVMTAPEHTWEGPEYAEYVSRSDRLKKLLDNVDLALYRESQP